VTLFEFARGFEQRLGRHAEELGRILGAVRIDQRLLATIHGVDQRLMFSGERVVPVAL